MLWEDPDWYLRSKGKGKARPLIESAHLNIHHSTSPASRPAPQRRSKVKTSEQVIGGYGGYSGSGGGNSSRQRDNAALNNFLGVFNYQKKANANRSTGKKGT